LKQVSETQHQATFANCNKAGRGIIFQWPNRRENSMPKLQPLLFTVPANALDYEIAQEKAAAVGRLGRALERALGALRDYEAAQTPESGSQADHRDRRSALVAEAAHVLWMYVVQREACGLRDSRAVMRDYQVPAEVQHRMGASRQCRQ
jgi:hypothetical protein